MAKQKPLHWTQTPEGRARMSRLARSMHTKKQEPQEEDRLHLLYSLPGMEMAARSLIEKINSIRSLLNQPPWSANGLEPQTKTARRILSPTSHRKMAQAQRERWRRSKAAQRARETEPSSTKPKRKLSPKQLRAMRENIAKGRAALKTKQVA